MAPLKRGSDILPAQPSHWDDIRSIYQQGIRTGTATFETEVPDWDAWDRTHLIRPRLVGVVDGEVAGWAALSPVSARCVYSGVAGVSVYVGEDHRGRGVGSQLLARLIEESEQSGIWTLEARLFPENRGSIMIHERLGFRRVGIRERLGHLNGRWRDVVLMERRSGSEGTPPVGDQIGPATAPRLLGAPW